MHPVSQHRHPLKLSAPSFSNRHSLRNVAVLPQLAARVDEDPSKMPNIKTGTDVASSGKADIRDDLMPLEPKRMPQTMVIMKRPKP